VTQLLPSTPMLGICVLMCQPQIVDERVVERIQDTPA